MGLARIAGTAFSDWGPAFQTVMMAIIMINMLLGPPLFRTALIQVSMDMSRMGNRAVAALASQQRAAGPCAANCCRSQLLVSSMLSSAVITPPVVPSCLAACHVMQVGEARAHSLPLGQQPQHLHRDSSAGVADLTSSVLPLDGHSSTNAPNSGDNAGSLSKGWTQRSHTEQLRPHLSPKLASDLAGSGGTTGLGSRPNKGAALEGSGGGGDAESHHVVMSSGALLHHLGASSQQRTSGD
jgi:hypothetical protein